MLTNSILTQVRVMIVRKEFKCAAFFMFAYAYAAFIYSLSQNQGVDLAMMKDASQLVCFSDFHRLWYYFYLVYPFLVVLPFATSYVEDYQNRLLAVYVSRISREYYYISKVIVCFLGTAVLVLIPCIINMSLCAIFLPHNNNMLIGEYQMGNYYKNLLGMNIAYSTDYPAVPMMKLFLLNPYLYNLVYLIIFSLFTGLMAALTLSFSFLLNKSKLLLFIPVFLLLRTSDLYDTFRLDMAIEDVHVKYIDYSIMDYVTPSLSSGQNQLMFLFFCIALAVVVMCLTILGIKKDLRSLQ